MQNPNLLKIAKKIPPFFLDYPDFNQIILYFTNKAPVKRKVTCIVVIMQKQHTQTQSQSDSHIKTNNKNILSNRKSI
jgi:hypothetical protein